MPKTKNQTLSLKKQFCFKKAYKFKWKNATEPFSKMPETKKIKHSHWKNNSVSKKLVNSYEKGNALIGKKRPFQKGL